jgi:branched-chain amino acid transport system permease protein
MNAYIQTLIIYCGINIILAVSLNLVNGFTGQFSIGHAGFMAVGAYSSAYLSMTFPQWAGPIIGINFFLNTLIGGLLAALAGLAVGLPSLRLKGDYLAIVTLGFGEIIRVVLLNIDAVGGARGMYGIPQSADFFWTAAWVFVTILFLVRLINSTHGRTFLSVREDEIAAESMGINTTRVKVTAFVISSFFAGVAGSLFAHYLRYLNPSTFSFMKSIDVVVMVVLGGMGSFSGSVLAAIIITLLPEALRPLQEITKTDFRMVIYSLTLVFLMLTRPKGLFGKNEISDLWRRYVRRAS